jgi:hypothetical protein
MVPDHAPSHYDNVRVDVFLATRTPLTALSRRFTFSTAPSRIVTPRCAHARASATGRRVSTRWSSGDPDGGRRGESKGSISARAPENPFHRESDRPAVLERPPHRLGVVAVEGGDQRSARVEFDRCVGVRFQLAHERRIAREARACETQHGFVAVPVSRLGDRC